MKQRVADLLEITDNLFSARMSLMSLLQEIAENFYVERADFTSQRTLGEDYAAHLMSGGPALIRRELADQIAGMIRPAGKTWFSLKPADDDLADDPQIIAWSKDKCQVMYNAMYDTKSRFTRAAKETDNDYACFGQGVMTIEADEETSTLLYRNWHFRDTVWKENDRLAIDTIGRNWSIQARAMCNNPRWSAKAHANVKKIAEKEPFKEIPCRHIILPFDEYDYTAKDGRKIRPGKFAFMSLLVDRENETILEERPLVDHQYIIPRWQTVSGSQYAHSPATVIALPDARVLQAITSTLLEAGEKATNPPMVAVQEALRSDIQIYAGGFTYLDKEYDERTGEAVRPLPMDWSGLKIGYDMADKHEEIIRKAFYLDKLLMPTYDGKEMTATEVRRRTEEYIRSALPLFEPIEADYSGQLCEKTWNLLYRYGAFGNPKEWPQALSSANMKWKFESPLASTQSREEALAFQETAQLLAIAAEIDPSLKNEYDARTHFRRAIKGLGAPLVAEDEAEEKQAEMDQMAQAQAMLSMAEPAMNAAKNAGQAVQAFAGAGQAANGQAAPQPAL